MTSSEYRFDPSNFEVTEAMKKGYDENGYIMLRGFVDEEELTKIRKCVEDSGMVDKYGYGLSDGQGKEAKFVIWSHPGNDVTGLLARSEKVVTTSEKLLGGGEAYHYHTKLIRKDAFTGGAHLWHQDYGYWYKNGCLFPDMLTVFVAIDKCTKANGCLQILKGSNRCGRIEHGMYAGQTQADVERVKSIKNICPLEYVEMEPGDALFFSCNLIHTSEGNNSPDRRWALLFSYNLKSNNPTMEHHHPCYTPLQKVPDSAIKECTNYNDFTGKEFLDPNKDKTTKVSNVQRDVEK